MADRYDDDDDWVGEPPEGHYTRERADPGFWKNQRPVNFLGAAILLVVVVLVIVFLL